MSMGDDKTTTISLSWLFWMAVWGCVGYLVYGNLQGAISLALFSAATGIVLWFGVIPIIGIFFTYFALNLIQGWILNYITMSWAVSAIFWLGVLGSVLCTCLILILIIARD